MSAQNDLLTKIVLWINECATPNDARRYSRRPVCNHSWWDDKERHEYWCWVPDAKHIAENTEAKP